MHRQDPGAELQAAEIGPVVIRPPRGRALHGVLDQVVFEEALDFQPAVEVIVGSDLDIGSQR